MGQTLNAASSAKDLIVAGVFCGNSKQVYIDRTALCTPPYGLSHIHCLGLFEMLEILLALNLRSQAVNSWEGETTLQELFLKVLLNVTPSFQ